MSLKTKTVKANCIVCGKEFFKLPNTAKTRTRRILIRPRNSVTCSKRCAKIRLNSQGEEHLFEKWKFVLLESGLWKCEECGTTFENENECNKHKVIE